MKYYLTIENNMSDILEKVKTRGHKIDQWLLGVVGGRTGKSCPQSKLRKFGGISELFCILMLVVVI